MVNKAPYYLIIIAIFVIASFMSVTRYESLHSTVMDFAVYTDQFYNVNHLNNWKSVFSTHIQPFVLLYAWVYSLFPELYAHIPILLIQNLLLILPSVWILKEFGRAGALSYLLFFPLWFNFLFDFHIDHIAVPLLYWFFIFHNRGQFFKSSLCALGLILVKDIFLFQALSCGLYLIFFSNIKYRLKGALYGLIIIIVGLFLLYLYKELPIAVLNINYNFEFIERLQDRFDNKGVIDFFNTLLSELSTEGKAKYILLLFFALGFVPLLAPKYLLVAAPILASSLLSDSVEHYNIASHYTIGLIVPMMLSFINGLSIAKKILIKINFSSRMFFIYLYSFLLLLHVAISPSPISRLFWSSKIWNYNYMAYVNTSRDLMIKKTLNDVFSRKKNIYISIQNSLNWSPLLNGNKILLFPLGVTPDDNGKYIKKGVSADYVVVDTKRPWYVLDKGCDWVFNKCTNNDKAMEYLSWIDKSRRTMNVLFEKDGFIILKKK